MARTLAEPAVLAAAKDALYPDLDTTTEHYAVTETQFTQSTWGGWDIPDDLRQRAELTMPFTCSDGSAVRALDRGVHHLRH